MLYILKPLRALSSTYILIYLLDKLAEMEILQMQIHCIYIVTAIYSGSIVWHKNKLIHHETTHICETALLSWHIWLKSYDARILWWKRFTLSHFWGCQRSVLGGMGDNKKDVKTKEATIKHFLIYTLIHIYSYYIILYLRCA